MSSSTVATDYFRKTSDELEKDDGHHATEAKSLPLVGTSSGRASSANERGDVEKGGVKLGGPPAFDPRHNPDGGLEAWLVLVGGFCCLFCSFGWINCIGVFQEYYQTHQLRSYTSSTIAWIPSCEVFFMFALGPLIGYFFDSYGPRYILLLGTFLHVFGLMMTSLSTEYYQFLLAQGFCSAAGASMCFYPAISVMPTWFFRRRAAAFGAMAAGSSIAGVIFPIMVAQLIPKVGFAWTMRICAFLILFMMTIANMTIKSRLTHRRKKFDILDFLRPLREPPFVLMTLASLFFCFGLFLPINYLPLEAISFGMSQRLSSYLISILNAASLFGRVLPGIIADKIGRFNAMVVLSYFTGIIVLALWLPATANTPIIIFAALYGFGSGAFVSLAPALTAQITPDVRQIGVRTGTVFAFMAIAALCGNPIGGAIIDADQGSWVGLQIWCGVMCIVGASGFLAARVKLEGWRVGVKV
ncbi:hypothetical protein AAFC00_001179 [Neodothiora populina]